MKKLILTPVLWLLSCGVCIADPNVEPALQAVSRHERPVSDIRVTYEVGKSADWRGKDKLAISGDGRMTVEHFEGNQSTVFEDILTDETVMMIVNEMLESRFWLAQRPGRRRPEQIPFDSTDIIIHVSTIQRDLDFSMTSLETEAKLNPHLINLVKAFEVLIDETLAEQ